MKAGRSILIFIICCIVIASQLSAAIVSQEVQVTYGFENPFFLNYTSTSFLIVCFGIQFLYNGIEVAKTNQSEQNSKSSLQSLFLGLFTDVRKYTNMSWKKLLPLGLVFSLLWVGANYLFTMALSRTNIASSLTLEQSTTIFVFILSAIFLKERITVLKLIAVGLCIVGVVLIAIGDQLQATETTSFFSNEAIIGDLLVLGSSLCASLYMVFYKKLLSDLPLAMPAVNYFIACIGLSVFLFYWPILILLSYFGIENYSDFSAIIIVLIILGTLLSFSFNYSLNYGMIITSPLFMRVVIIFGVPVSFIVNVFEVGFEEFSIIRVFGAGFIVVGFLIFTVHSAKLELLSNDRNRVDIIPNTSSEDVRSDYSSKLSSQ